MKNKSPLDRGIRRSYGNDLDTNTRRESFITIRDAWDGHFRRGNGYTRRVVRFRIIHIDDFGRNAIASAASVLHDADFFARGRIGNDSAIFISLAPFAEEHDFCHGVFLSVYNSYGFNNR